MKLYRHYKNKDYQVIGSARHSETQEDLVLYKCLYENPASNVWVRPKELFYGDLDVNGATVPRFRERLVSIENIEAISSADLLKVVELSKNILPGVDVQQLQQRLFDSGKKTRSLIFASIDNEIVGFKIGYEVDSNIFYSWLGGVSGGARQLGIASYMMTAQHEWCGSKGFSKVKTKTMNAFSAMIQLNLKFGFQISDFEKLENSADFKLVMEKIL